MQNSVTHPLQFYGVDCASVNCKILHRERKEKISSTLNRTELLTVFLEIEGAVNEKAVDVCI